ncbi:MAG: molybdenum cofactor guanylyltransferase [Spirochaetales bacterium]|nr:molybdenum cofactor guanylyltransferase [Spirochaetales bacterium]
MKDTTNIEVNDCFCENSPSFAVKNASAIILAGGESSRMGKNKSLLLIDGVPMIQHIYSQLAPYFKEILVATNNTKLFDFLNIKIVNDHETCRGPLAGISAGLEASKYDINFMVACDIPDIDIRTVYMMIDEAEGHDGVIPTTKEGYMEPMFAIYRKSMLPAVRQTLLWGENKILKVFPYCKIKYLNLGKADWLRNLNTENDYTKYISELRQNELVTVENTLYT